MNTHLASMQGIVWRWRATALACAVLALSVAACSGDKPSAPVVPSPTPTPSASPIVEAALVTATPSPTPAEAPSPMPTPAFATPARAAAAGKAYFPPPQPRESAPPASGVGIARVVAPHLGLDHYVEVDRIIDNEMEPPRDGSYAVGFYPDFGLPGTGGNAIFSAHETWNHFQGPFYQLGQAKVGDEIAVVMTDGKQLRYRVLSNTKYDLATIPMADLLWPPNRPAGEEWITLYTCGGRIVYDSSGFGEYLDRDFIVAKRVS